MEKICDDTNDMNYAHIEDYYIPDIQLDGVTPSPTQKRGLIGSQSPKDLKKSKELRIENVNTELKMPPRYGILSSDNSELWEGRGDMRVCYNKLWKLLIDKGMYRTDLAYEAGVTTNVIAHMGKNEDIRVSALVKICGVLGCTFDDIMEILPDEEEKQNG